MINCLKKKSFSDVLENKKGGLPRTLGALDLVIIGLGLIVGTGVLLITGDVAAKYCGPAVVLSYAIAGFVCIFVALSYTELATTVPSSGGLYSYAYVAYGEIFAWLAVGILMLQLLIGASAVAAGWAANVIELAKVIGINIPLAISRTPSEGGSMHVIPGLIIALLSYVLYRGTKDSKIVNLVLVVIKISIFLLFLFLAIPHVNISHYDNFMPFGIENVLSGSAILFFSYTGFTSLSCLAEECKNPTKDLKVGIIVSLLITTLIYIILSGTLVGLSPCRDLANPSPFASVLKMKGMYMGSAIVAFGSICAMTNVLLVLLYTISRVFYTVGRDGLIPKCFSSLHSKYHSPYIAIIFFGFIAVLLSGFIHHEILVQLAGMGAIADYILALSIVIFLRMKEPTINRPFTCPMLFIIAPCTLCICIYLLYIRIIDTTKGTLLTTGKLFIYWLIAFIVIYFLRFLFIGKDNVKNTEC